MNALQRGIILLLKSALSGQTYALPDGFDIDQAADMSRAHHMSAMVYTGAVNCGIDKNHPAMQQLFRLYYKSLMVSERQMADVQRLYAAFEAGGIDYMPLKGSILKALYPMPELRMMGDADILIRESQYEQIIPMLKDIGFSGGREVVNTFVWQSSGLCLELHNALMPKEYPDLHAYFGDGWSFARKTEGFRHEMSPEDTFVFLFAHFAKHFSNAGVGCRHILDLWVYRNAHPDMDEAYIESCLGQIAQRSFYLNIRKLLKTWFEDAPADDRTIAMTEYIMNNGSWGNMDNFIIAQNARSNTAAAKCRYVLKAIYPGFEVLRKEYPVLKKAPVMLPVIAVWRLMTKICSRSVRRRKMHGFTVLQKENIDQHTALMRLFGLKM